MCLCVFFVLRSFKVSHDEYKVGFSYKTFLGNPGPPPAVPVMNNIVILFFSHRVANYCQGQSSVKEKADCMYITTCGTVTVNEQPGGSWHQFFSFCVVFLFFLSFF